MSDDLGIKIGGDSSGAEAALARVATAAEREMRRTAQATAFAQIAAREYEKALKQSAATSEAVASHASGGGGPTSGITRELLVLSHEASQGNFKRFAGSLVVLAEYSGTATNALHALMGPLGAVLGVAGLVGLAFFRGAQEQDAFNKSLILTGNFAGLTAGKLDSLVKSVSASTNGTAGGARDALQAIVSSGRFGPGMIDQTAQAVMRLERLTGEDASKIVGDFSSMGDGVAKWAAEHNKQYHFLSAAQYEYIRTLEQQGDTERAQQATIGALNDSLKSHSLQIGYVGSAWLSVKQAVSGYFDQLAGLGRAGNIDSEIDRIQKRVATLKSDVGRDKDTYGGGLLGNFLQGGHTKDLAEMEQLLARLKDSKKLADDVAAATAKSQKIQGDAIAASDIVKRITEENDKRSKATKLVEEYTAAVKKMRAANDPNAPSLKQESQTIALINQRNRNPGDKAGENFVKNLQRQVEAATRGKEEMLRLEAAQKGVAAAAQPYISELEEIEARNLRIRRIVQEAAEAELQHDKVNNFITSSNAQSKAIIDQTNAIGLNADQLKRYNAMQSLDAQLKKDLAGADSQTVVELLHQEAIARQNIIDRISEQKAAQDAYNADPANGVAIATKKYIDGAKDQAAFAESLVTNSLKRAEDAFVEFAKTGKLHLGDLFSYMAEEYLRNLLKMQMAKFLDGNGSSSFDLGSVISAATSFFSGTGIGTDSTGGSDFGSGGLIGGGRAGGGDVKKGMLYPVGEQGTEMFRAPADGTIIPNDKIGGGTSHDFSVTIGSVGAGVSRSEMYAAVSQAQAEQEKRLRRVTRQQGALV